MRRWPSIAVLVGILLFAAAPPAQAYIDPGNTSMVVQLVVGGIAAAAVLGRRLWQAVRRQLDR